MHRFYLPTAAGQGSELSLDEREAHHATHVLRLRRGDPVTVLDGAGSEFRCEVRELGRDSVELLVLDRKRHSRPSYQITLIQALPKGKTMETIVQKATELGVSRVVPLLSERSVPQFDSDEAKAKAGKWQAVAVEAIKQCGSPWLPGIEPPIRLVEFVRRAEPFDLSLVASLQHNCHPRECFRQFQSLHGRLPTTAAAWVGPEGDFTAREVDAIQAAGACPITLGPRVLRADTAAVFCLSILSYELQS